MIIFLFLIEGAPGEAAEVLPGGRSSLRDGQVKGGAESPGPCRWHDQLQGERWALRWSSGGFVRELWKARSCWKYLQVCEHKVSLSEL